jgi:hypothetical protein
MVLLGAAFKVHGVFGGGKSGDSAQRGRLYLSLNTNTSSNVYLYDRLKLNMRIGTQGERHNACSLSCPFEL